MADILIVEDEKNISNLIEMALSRHGHKTDCVFDGESCADVLEKKHFDLILLDVMLPKISGFELMDYIKGFDTPVIFITAKSDIKEYEILLLFVRNKNIALYREMIYERVWNEPYMGDTRTVDLHIQRLRKKLDLKDNIQSVYKVGYRLVE